jgi:anti-sigma-K factor RskA
MTKQYEELACLYVLDQLDSDERAAFETRLLREPALAELVRELEPVLLHGVRELPRHEPPAGTLARIEARIAALRETTPEQAPEPRRSWNPFRSEGGAALALDWFSLARWGVAAVIAVSLATIAIQGLRPSAAQPVFVFVGLDANRSTFAELPQREPAKDPDARFIQLATLAENFWRKPAELPAWSVPAPGDSRAYTLFDPGSRQGFIVVEQLPAAAEGQSYHLWVVDPGTGSVRDAGSLPLDGMSRGLYSFAIGSDDSLDYDRPNFFITLEEASAESSAPAEPRGKVVLGRGKI